MERKQQGFTLIELMVVLGIMAVVIGVVLGFGPSAKFLANKLMFYWDANQIVSATNSWKAGRSNFANVSLSVVCGNGELSKRICGSSNDGKSTNPFGGDWSVTVNTSSKGLFNVVATLPQDTDRLAAMADFMASSTRGNCTEATGCSTITKGTTSLTMVY